MLMQSNDDLPSPSAGLMALKALKDNNLTVLLLILIGLSVDAQSYIGGMC